MSGFADRNPSRVLLLFLFPRDTKRRGRLASASELYELTVSLGGVEVVDMVAKRGPPNKSTYFGPGHLAEIAAILTDRSVDGIVIGGILEPRQLDGIWRQLIAANPNITVWDRIDLILAIFKRHAFTSEANLQIRLAAMRHMGPRMYGMGLELSNQSAGIGTRGIGETNLERMRRHWKREIRIVSGRLKKIETIRRRAIIRRKSAGIFTAALVGYTSAGKTALFNALTGKDKFVKEYLFTTLDTTTGQVHLSGQKHPVLVSDTIGFIRDLPPSLIQAFRSTLLESLHAELILHVIDLSDPQIELKITAVTNVLEELGVSQKPTVYVFTKLDLAPKRRVSRMLRRFARFRPVFVSSLTGYGLPVLKRRLESVIGEAGNRNSR